MSSLDISSEELSILADDARALALDYWASIEQRPAYPQTDGNLTSRLFGRDWDEDGLGRAVLQEFKLIADHSRPSGGKFFGYVFGSGEPVGVIGDFLASAVNQNFTAWQSAPAATAVEHAVVGWLADAVGCKGFHGTLCSGGTTANLMGLAMAREAKCPANDDGARPCTVYASDQVHKSTSTAVALLGIGRNNLRLIPTDAGHRMFVDLLQAAIAADRAEGRQPIAIVASAGTVVCGAIDPPPEIAAVARREAMWMHVDGAFGALAALAVPEMFVGLAESHSLSLDAPKWLYQPPTCSCLLYRDRGDARRAFSPSSDYVRTFSHDPAESFTFFGESLELSRPFRALKLWMSLRYHGRRAFREAIARDLRHARVLADLISACPQLELLSPPVLSVVCFRHRDKDNEAVLQRMIARGQVYLSNATVRGHFALRACFVNHRTTEGDVAAIVSETLAAAAEVN